MVEFFDEVGPSDATETLFDVTALFGLVPEEILSLGEFFTLALGREDGFEGIGVEARIPRLGGNGHGGGCEVLHLFQMEIKLLGQHGQFGHICFLTARVAADEVGDELLVQALLAVDTVEDALELIELLERWFAHESQHAVAGVLRGHLQASAHMAADEFTGVLLGSAVGGFVLAPVEQQVVAHTAADEALLDTCQGIDGMIDVEQLAVVGVEVGTDLRMDATGPPALLAVALVASAHAVHIGRGTAEVGEVAFEVGHPDDLFHLFQDALLGAAGDELALVGGDGAEGTAAKAATMDVDGELDHLEGRDALALVLGVWLARVGQVEGGVEFLGGHRRVGGIDDDETPVDTLQQTTGMYHVRLLFDVAVVLGLGTFVFQAFFVAVQHDIVLADAAGDVFLAGEIDGLRYVADVLDACSLFQSVSQFEGGLLAHTIGNHVGPGVAEDALPQAILPVVVVGEPAHGGLDAAQHHRHIGKELFQDLGVDDGRVFRPHVVATVGAVGIFGTQATVGGVFVDHRVHTPGGDAEKETGAPELLEVAEVAVPVGLWHDGHPIACCL